MHLQQSGRTNVIYSMAKVLGTMRSDGSDSLLPARRMPMGLIEHTVNVFSASSIHQVLPFSLLLPFSGYNYYLLLSAGVLPP